MIRLSVYLEVENLPDVGQLVVAYIKFLKILIILKENLTIKNSHAKQMF